ncbi:hypothetical protein C7999DRAFT_13616 [Corynascus novoguineensis]|uniref:NmrA-like domain-containing protein n=1 Tax=Corynascus novoguineensis TaxID=1126955 RepID=A0AAN7CUD3_9PEZI|nr:hypothetical protein C7999DRAFT_13616 [Corynascus novoguineensis]
MSASSQTPTILVLGGTGTVGSRVVKQLSSSPQQYRILLASRNGAALDKKRNSSSSSEPAQQNQASEIRHVFFDWHNRDTWSTLFSSSSPVEEKAGGSSSNSPGQGHQIAAVFLVAPTSVDSDRLLSDLIDVAREAGRVRRFVLLSASPLDKGGPAMGQAHAYLDELGQRGEVEWACLRPTWFQQNFVTQAAHVKSIREEGKIYSATGDGKIPWVSADDIAAVAVRTLTDERAHNTDYLILGPDLLSYGDIATILSDVLGRKIVHVNLTTAELEKRHQESGIPEEYAKMLAAMDTPIRAGSENRTNDVILRITGAAPRKFRDLADSVQDVW